LVSSPSETLLVLGRATSNTDSFESPQPKLRGSHHLPPYSIFCIAPLHPHPNGFYSWASQGGDEIVPIWTPRRLWELITPGSNLGLRWGLKQTCSSPQDLSNGMLHSTYTHWDRVDSWLFMVGSQIANLIPILSFDHNLCYRCPNGSCEAIFDIYTSRPFQRYKEHLKARCFDVYNWVLKLRESRRTPSSHFWECESHLHTCLKVGLRHLTSILACLSSSTPKILPWIELILLSMCDKNVYKIFDECCVSSISFHVPSRLDYFFLPWIANLLRNHK